MSPPVPSLVPVRVLAHLGMSARRAGTAWQAWASAGGSEAQQCHSVPCPQPSAPGLSPIVSPSHGLLSRTGLGTGAVPHGGAVSPSQGPCAVLYLSQPLTAPSPTQPWVQGAQEPSPGDVPSAGHSLHSPLSCPILFLSIPACSVPAVPFCPIPVLPYPHTQLLHKSTAGTGPRSTLSCPCVSLSHPLPCPFLSVPPSPPSGLLHPSFYPPSPPHPSLPVPSLPSRPTLSPSCPLHSSPPPRGTHGTPLALSPPAPHGPSLPGVSRNTVPCWGPLCDPAVTLRSPSPRRGGPAGWGVPAPRIESFCGPWGPWLQGLRCCPVPHGVRQRPG